MKGEGEPQSVDEYIDDMIESGYLNKDLSPNKCINCDSKDMEQTNVDRLDGWRDTLEYDVKCKDCGAITGHWAYGHWQF